MKNFATVGLILFILCAIAILGWRGDVVNFQKPSVIPDDSIRAEEHSGINNIKLYKYSERIDGSREITTYQSSDHKVRATVFKNEQPPGFTESALVKELMWVVPDSNRLQLNEPLSTFQLAGHMAISYRIWQIVPDSGLRTNNIPDLYVTVISYPVRNIILSITSNGENMTSEIHNEIVDEFKL